MHFLYFRRQIKEFWLEGKISLANGENFNTTKIKIFSLNLRNNNNNKNI